jgi:hypothetical protein
VVTRDTLTALDPANKDVVKIGLQIRTGDDVITGREVARPEKLQPWFHCAEEIERTRSLPGQTVVWYLISDSVAMRQYAKERYGEKLLTTVFQPAFFTEAAGSDVQNFVMAVGEVGAAPCQGCAFLHVSHTGEVSTTRKGRSLGLHVEVGNARSHLVLAP